MAFIGDRIHWIDDDMWATYTAGCATTISSTPWINPTTTAGLSYNHINTFPQPPARPAINKPNKLLLLLEDL